MTIQYQEKLGIDLRTALSQLSADVTGDFAEGSVTVYFEGPMMPLVGQITMTNPMRRMAFESEMVDNAPGLGLLPRELNGLWWGLGGGRDGKIVVTNTSGATASADLFIDVLGERHAGPLLTFKPHESKTLNVSELLAELKLSAAQAPQGGITIIPRGPNPSLVAQGKITDAASGLSANLNFPYPQVQNASALHASGVPIGIPSKDSPYAGMGAFVPHVVVRNLLSVGQSVTITVEYPGKDGPQWTPLAPIPLGPHETRDVSLDQALSQLPLPLPFCSIRIQHSGAPGTAMAEVSSLEARGDLVIDSRVANEGDGWVGSGANPWRLDEETESILFLTNMGEEDCPIGFRMQANGVTYYLTDLLLAPRETRAIDIRKLRDAQKPDLFGTVPPAAATDGSVTWIRLGRKPLMGRLIVLRKNQGIASNYDCDLCCCGPWPTWASVTTPSSATKSVGQTQQFRFDAGYADCYGGFCYYDRTGFPNTTWTSNAPSIASVSSTSPTKGLATALAGGSAGIEARYVERLYACEPYSGQCIDQGNDAVIFGNATLNVPVPSVSLSPTEVQPSGQTTVTVQATPAMSGLQVTLAREEIQYSGAHNHLSRPLGSFGASSGTTNAQGRFQTTYTASLFGGQEKIKATMSGVTSSATLIVKIAGLAQLVDGANFDLTGSTPTHLLPYNHYGTVSANSDLVAIANAYASVFPGSILLYNDQSLTSGGLFDINANWSTPHSEHRLGINCDVSKSNVPVDRRGALEAIFGTYGTFLDEGNHWHLRL